MIDYWSCLIRAIRWKTDYIIRTRRVRLAIQDDMLETGRNATEKRDAVIEYDYRYMMSEQN